jgi:hypothetical protein
LSATRRRSALYHDEAIFRKENFMLNVKTYPEPGRFEHWTVILLTLLLSGALVALAFDFVTMRQFMNALSVVLIVFLPIVSYFAWKYRHVPYDPDSTGQGPSLC